VTCLMKMKPINAMSAIYLLFATERTVFVRVVEISQSIIVLAMMPLSLVGRVFYRRATDATLTEKDARPTCNDVDLQQLLQLQQQQQSQQLVLNDVKSNLQDPPYLTKSNKSAISNGTTDGDDHFGDNASDLVGHNDNDGELEIRGEVTEVGTHRISVCDTHGEGLDCSLWHHTSV